MYKLCFLITVNILFNVQIIKGLLFDITDDMTFSFKISDLFYEVSLISADDSNTHLSLFQLMYILQHMLIMLILCLTTFHVISHI